MSAFPYIYRGEPAGWNQLFIVNLWHLVLFNVRRGTESVQVGTNSAQMLPNAEITASSVPAIDFFGNYQVASGLTATEDNMTVEVTCDPAFPFTSGDMCLLKVSNNQYLNCLSDSQTTTGATNTEVTGVKIIEALQSGEADLPVYDLSGHRVMNPTKGIYIRGGKKITIQ